LAVIISEFYESQIEIKTLDKTQDEVIIYSNTESKLKEIMKELLITRENLSVFRQQGVPNEQMDEDRKTVHKRLNETVFDEDYVSEKVKEISVNYLDGNGRLKQAMV
jgi:hypothetical protein